MGKKAMDISGKRFGNLVVIERSENKHKSGGVLWRCKCDCGNKTEILGSLLNRGVRTNCGCKDEIARNKNGQFKSGENIKDITGQKFGKLTVVGFDKIINHYSYWIVKCDCGTVKSVRKDTLKIIKSCGCEKKKQDLINLNVKNNHKLSKNPLYSIWIHMIQRCEKEYNASYSSYGGRGISVCDEWHDLNQFVKWAYQSGFQEGRNLSIERKNVNGDYCPENCCWIDKSKQCENKQDTVRLTIDGEEKTLIEWSRIYGIPKEHYNRVWYRYHRGHRDPDYLFYKGKYK